MTHDQLYEQLTALSHTVREDGHHKVSDVLNWLAVCMCDNPSDAKGQALKDFWFDARKSYERIMSESDSEGRKDTIGTKAK
jgi:hypothetical protein